MVKRNVASLRPDPLRRRWKRPNNWLTKDMSNPQPLSRTKNTLLPFFISLPTPPAWELV